MLLRILALTLFLPVLLAQEPGISAAPTPAAAPDEVSGSWGIDFTTAYFFRGILQENQGVIVEPHFELDYKLYSSTGTLRDLHLVLGQWNSLHNGPSGSSGPGGSIWYESDFYASLRAGVGERWTAGTTYTNYYSPNGRFRSVEELAVGLAFDDKGLLGEAFAGLQPSALVGFELHGQAVVGSYVGTYAQLCLAPKFELGKAGDLELSLALPVTAGFSLSQYYQDAAGEDHAFGYVDVGCVLGSPLPFLPSRLGPWTASLGVHLLLLGDSNERLNGGDSSEWIGTFGLSTTF